MTYNGYKYHGTEGAFVVARALHDHWGQTGSLPDDLAALRCALFMAQQSAHWTEFSPDQDGPWVRALVKKIRELGGGSVTAAED